MEFEVAILTRAKLYIPRLTISVVFEIIVCIWLLSKECNIKNRGKIEFYLLCLESTHHLICIQTGMVRVKSNVAKQNLTDCIFCDLKIKKYIPNQNKQYFVYTITKFVLHYNLINKRLCLIRYIRYKCNDHKS